MKPGRQKKQAPGPALQPSTGGCLQVLFLRSGAWVSGLCGTPSPLSAEITSHLLPRPPRLLLLVNPFGGRGLAWQLCKNHVLPMISEAGLSFNLIQTGKGGVRMGGEGFRPNSGALGGGRACLTRWFPTSERQNHARELVQGLSLSEWDGIVTVSGDGLLYEVGQEAWAPSPGGGLWRPGTVPRCPISGPPGAERTPRSP